MGVCWYGRGAWRPPSHDHHGAPGPRVVYLGGLGRSGTTLLERLLAARPGVCAAGETVHLWQRGLVACVTVSPDQAFAEQVLQSVEREAASLLGPLLVGVTTEWLA